MEQLVQYFLTLGMDPVGAATMAAKLLGAQMREPMQPTGLEIGPAEVRPAPTGLKIGPSRAVPVMNDKELKRFTGNPSIDARYQQLQHDPQYAELMKSWHDRAALFQANPALMMSPERAHSQAVERADTMGTIMEGFGIFDRYPDTREEYQAKSKWYEQTIKDMK